MTEDNKKGQFGDDISTRFKERCKLDQSTEIYQFAKPDTYDEPKYAGSNRRFTGESAKFALMAYLYYGMGTTAVDALFSNEGYNPRGYAISATLEYYWFPTNGPVRGSLRAAGLSPERARELISDLVDKNP